MDAVAEELLRLLIEAAEKVGRCDESYDRAVNRSIAYAKLDRARVEFEHHKANYLNHLNQEHP